MSIEYGNVHIILDVGWTVAIEKRQLTIGDITLTAHRQRPNLLLSLNSATEKDQKIEVERGGVKLYTRTLNKGSGVLMLDFSETAGIYKIKIPSMKCDFVIVWDGHQSRARFTIHAPKSIDISRCKAVG